MEGKCIIYFPNIDAYISEYYFQNHYMLIVKYICDKS